MNKKHEIKKIIYKWSGSISPVTVILFLLTFFFMPIVYSFLSPIGENTVWLWFGMIKNPKLLFSVEPINYTLHSDFCDENCEFFHLWIKNNENSTSISTLKIKIYEIKVL